MDEFLAEAEKRNDVLVDFKVKYMLWEYRKLKWLV